MEFSGMNKQYRKYIRTLQIIGIVGATAILLSFAVLFPKAKHIWLYTFVSLGSSYLVLIALGFIVKNRSSYRINDNGTVDVRFSNGNLSKVETTLTQKDVQNIYKSRRPFFKKMGLVDLSIATTSGDIPIDGVSDEESSKIHKVLLGEDK